MQFKSINALEQRFRIVISFGPTAADEKAIHIKAFSSNAAYNKALEYCEYHNIKNPSINVE